MVIGPKSWSIIDDLGDSWQFAMSPVGNSTLGRIMVFHGFLTFTCLKQQMSNHIILLAAKASSCKRPGKMIMNKHLIDIICIIYIYIIYICYL